MPIKVVVVNDEKFPTFPMSVPTEEYLQGLRDMPMREDDIIIPAFSKSGTHWLWEEVHMLTSGTTEYESRAKEHLMLEFNEAEKFVSMPSPRIINTHLHLRYLSQEIVTKRLRVLHVLRNPKDIVVSYYFHMRQMKGFEDNGFLHFANRFLNGGGLPGSFEDYFAYLPEMEKWQKEHPEIPDPVEAVRQTAKFLGVEASDSFCADIAEACSFKKLKVADEGKDNPVTRYFKDDTVQFYRKGEVGDWKNYFTVALNEQFDAAVAERFKDCAFAKRFQYTV